jgi:AMP deaminase
MGDLDAAKYQLVEWRISIYGKKYDEWQKLSKWFFQHKLAHPNVRWLIQVPRLFHLYKLSGDVTNFQDMLHNIFAPLFEASADPSAHPQMSTFLETIVGFDSVDDESRREYGVLSHGMIPTPDQYELEENPSYGYWMYYMYANVLALNKFRASRGLCTFQFRPHCGEAGRILRHGVFFRLFTIKYHSYSGDVEHLISAYLLANQINHGILLRKAPSLQYLYYLSQVGIAMSPLSNNKLFLEYTKNPFIKYFRQGMNVSLSTDDPLMLHYTKDALVEEYSVATQVYEYKYSTVVCFLITFAITGLEAQLNGSM